MKIPFCDAHIQAFFLLYAQNPGPLDLQLGSYFKNHKSLGANDRKQIASHVYGMVRWRSLIDWGCSPDAPVRERLAWYRSPNFAKAKQDPATPLFAQLGLSSFLFKRFEHCFGGEQAKEIGRILNTEAPITIRANRLKTDRASLMTLWGNVYDATACRHASDGIQFSKRLPLTSLPEFKEGLFEIQDEGSQLVASCIDAKPGDSILDFCSGSGGKTMAFAHKMQGQGQIYLHDIRASVLIQAKKRLKRAGIQNAQCLPSGHPQLARLQGKCDWVLIDVPCTGTGTLRRNPDQKWKIDASMLERLVQEQREIAHTAAAYLKPKGRLVYATCSILPEENQDQIAYFQAHLPLILETPPLALLPQEGGMDGFFAACFQKK